MAITDTLVRALEGGGVRLPAVRPTARVTRCQSHGSCYVRPFDVDPRVSPWALFVGLASAPTADVAARGRFANRVVLSEPCGTGALGMTLRPGEGVIELNRPVEPGQALVCEDHDAAGAYRVTERSELQAEWGGHCEWRFSALGDLPTAAEAGASRSQGGPPVPLTELLASGRPVFEAFASIQQTVCGDQASP